MYNPSQSSHLLNNLASRFGSSTADKDVHFQTIAVGSHSPQLHSISGILRKAGLLSDADLQEAAEIAQSTHSTVDQILRNSSFYTPLQYENAQKARQFITMSMSMEELVLAGLRLAFAKNMPLEEGMKKLGWSW
jgi:hypothetical protein